MKRFMILAVMAITAISLTGCDKGEDGNKPESLNIFKGTSWTAPDPVGELLWGKGATTTIEFLDDTNCQQVDFRPGVFILDPYEITQGTYSVNGNTATWIIEERETTGTISGTMLISDKSLTYKKNNQ